MQLKHFYLSLLKIFTKKKLIAFPLKIEFDLRENFK